MRNTTLLMLVAGVFVGFVGISESAAQSTHVDQGYRAEPSGGEDLVRNGLFGGLSFGRGSIAVSCDDCGTGTATLTEALSLEGHAGYMLTPQLAVIGEHWTIRYNARGGDLFDDSASHLVAQHVSSVGAQLFLGHSLWIRTGFGVGWHISDGEYAKRTATVQDTPSGSVALQQQRQPSTSAAAGGVGAAYFAAVGWEVAHSRSFVAEVQLRAASTHRSDDQYQVRNVGLNVGASWY